MDNVYTKTAKPRHWRQDRNAEQGDSRGHDRDSNESINLRTDEARRALIDRAAEATGKDRTPIPALN